MKRSSATHNIIGTRSPERMQSKIKEEVDQSKCIEPCEASHDLIEMMSKMRQETCTLKKSSYATCSTADADTLLSTTNSSSMVTCYEETPEEVMPEIREAKTIHSVAAKPSPIKKSKRVSLSFSTTKKDNGTMVVTTSPINKLSLSQDIIATVPKIKEATASHKIEKESVTKTKKLSFDSVASNSINISKKHPKKIIPKVKEAKATHGARDLSKVKISKPLYSVGSNVVKSNIFSIIDTDTDSGDFLELMPSVRETKAITHKSKRVKISEPTSSCSVHTTQAIKIKQSDFFTIKTSKASQGVAKTVRNRKKVTEMSKKIGVSAEKKYKLATIGDRATMTSNCSTRYSQDDTTDDNDEYFMKKSYDLSTVTRHKPGFNIVDEVYLRFREREKCTQTETKLTNKHKLLLETYLQTDEELSKESTSQQSKNAISASRDRNITTCIDNIEKSKTSNQIMVLSKEAIIEAENEEQLMELDSAVFEQAESTINVPHKASLNTDTSQKETTNTFLAAGDQLSKETEQKQGHAQLEINETEPFTTYSVLLKDLNQDSVAGKLNLMPRKKTSNKVQEINEKTSDATENVWNVLKSYVTLFIAPKEDFQSQTPKPTETEKVVQPDTTMNPWKVLKQYITFPFVNEGEKHAGASKSANPSGDEVGGAKSTHTPSAALGGSTPFGDIMAPRARSPAPLSSASEPYGHSSLEDQLPRRRQLGTRPTPGHVIKPKKIEGRSFNLGPVEVPNRPRTNDVGVQTEDDPEEPGRVVVCTCKNFIDTQKIKGTGMFLDHRRRIDYVLVVRNQMDEPQVELMKLTFLTNLVKTGFYLEAEQGMVHKDLLFIKLHASDELLHTYAGAFGVRRYFIDSHEEMINKKTWWEGLPFTKPFQFTEEREWIASMRYWYKRPLRLSNYDRSYVVHMILQYLSFGDRRNYFGIDRLKNNNIIVDAFALHNGPYHRALHTGSFNGRQVLYTNWAGVLNILWFQPLHLIHEYFGPKVGFYFTFYEFYNKALLVAALWGVFMMWVYRLQDLFSIFMMPTRNHTCKTRKNIRDEAIATEMWRAQGKVSWFYLWSTLVCAECEGAKELDVCPYTITNDLCFDLKIMTYFENQYIIMFSGGIIFLGIWFLAHWRRVESYWAYILELGTSESAAIHLIRPLHEPPPRPRNFRRRWRTVVRYHALRFAQCAACSLALPLLIIIIPWIIIFGSFVVGYEYTRLWSLKRMPATETVVFVPPVVNKVMEYSVLAVTVFAVQAVLYCIEKIFHLIALFITNKLENHSTYEKLEKSYIMCLFWITFNYTAHVVVFFAWLKGSFHNTPLSYWDVVVNVTLPAPMRRTLSVNLTQLFPGHLATLLRRAVTLNCMPFSCFRQAVVAFFSVLCFRVVAARLLECFFRRAKAFTIGTMVKYRAKLRVLPTVEREYMLQTVTEMQLMRSFNTLVSQMALVFLFAPAFPPAPLIAFIVNIWDIRNRAHLLLVYSRRAIFHKAVGIGAWNQVVKLICYSIPLFHVITIARTQCFVIYLFHKVYSRPFMPQVWTFGEYIRSFNFTSPWWYMKFTFLSNYMITKAAMSHSRFAEVNKDRVTETDSLDESATSHPYKAMFIMGNDSARMFRCRLNSFVISAVSQDNTFSRTSLIWPYTWNYIEENVTQTVSEPHHYEWYYYQTSYALVLLISSAILAVCVRRYVSPYSRDLDRRMLRERHLWRLHLPRYTHPRPAHIRRRETKLLNEYFTKRRM